MLLNVLGPDFWFTVGTWFDTTEFYKSVGMQNLEPHLGNLNINPWIKAILGTLPPIIMEVKNGCISNSN